MDIEELSRKIDKYHKEDAIRAKGNRHENLGFISAGFALATSGFAATTGCWIKIIVYSIASILLLILATIAFKKARKYRAEARKLKSK